MGQSYLYFIPLFPIIVRLSFFISFWEIMKDQMSPEAQDRDAHRNIVLPLMGISFTGAMAMYVVNGKVDDQILLLPSFYLLVSFISYFIVLNFQQYKVSRWMSNFSDAFFEIGNLCLIGSLFSIVGYSKPPIEYKIAVWMLLTLVWALDYIPRVKIMYSYWSRLHNKKLKGK